MARPTLRTHRKFRRLIAVLGMPEAHVLGHLEMMWAAAYESGDAYLGDPTDVELAAGWVGEPGTLADALATCGGPGRAGFIEEGEDPGTYLVHDLMDHAPDYVRGRAEKEAERRKPKTCACCGIEYRNRDPRSTYCSAACKTAAWREKQPKSSGVTEVVWTVSKRNETVTDCDATPTPAPSPTPKKEKDLSPDGDRPEGGKAGEVVEAWNTITAGKLPKARLTPPRVKTITTRLKEPGWMDDFRKACAFLIKSPWHLGQNDRQWTATLDFLLQAGKATELAEKATATPSHGATHGKPGTPHHRTWADQDWLNSQAGNLAGPGVPPHAGAVPEVPAPKPGGEHGPLPF